MTLKNEQTVAAIQQAAATSSVENAIIADSTTTALVKKTRMSKKKLMESQAHSDSSAFVEYAPKVVKVGRKKRLDDDDETVEDSAVSEAKKPRKRRNTTAGEDSANVSRTDVASALVDFVKEIYVPKPSAAASAQAAAQNALKIYETCVKEMNIDEQSSFWDKITCFGLPLEDLGVICRYTEEVSMRGLHVMLEKVKRLKGQQQLNARVIFETRKSIMHRQILQTVGNICSSGDESMIKKMMQRARLGLDYLDEHDEESVRVVSHMIKNMQTPMGGSDEGEACGQPCKACKSKDTFTYSIQLRAADEPMTLFVSCRTCKYQSKF